MTTYPPPPGYGQPPPGYGQPPPGYYQPPPQNYAPGPQIITISGDTGGTHCPYCNTKSNHIPRRVFGGAAIAWTVSLVFFGCLLCAWIPCVVDGCQDVELVCSNCHNVKATIPANCC